jgi:hypothetical protein
VTEELLTFHEAVNQMQEQEEELIDYHHQLAEVNLFYFWYNLRPAYSTVPTQVSICFQLYRIKIGILTTVT